MNGKKLKCFYFMHVRWSWIKQRPHFLALEISNDLNVDVYYPSSFKPEIRTSTKDDIGINVSKIWKLPFAKNSLIRKINRYIFIFQIYNKSISEYDIIWLTHPILLHYVMPYLSSHHRIVYDCMDNVLEFMDAQISPSYKQWLFSEEKYLISIADLVLFSSKKLQEVVEQRLASKSSQTHLMVNNALSVSFLRQSTQTNKEDSDWQDFLNINQNQILIGYFGTISTWFDFKILHKALSRFPNITFVLFGPTEVDTNPYLEDRMIFWGPIDHTRIHYYMAATHCLIMPFIISALIETVDPVKLYEYIATGKPILCPRYIETEKFSDYAYLYQNKDEFFHYLECLVLGDLNNKSQTEKINTFINNHTWEKRWSKIKDEYVKAWF